MKVLFLAALVLLAAPVVAQKPPTGAVRVQITYLYAPPKFTASSQIVVGASLGACDELADYKDAMTKGHFTPSIISGPVVTTDIDKRDFFETDTVLGPPTSVGANSKQIDSHIATVSEHKVTAFPRLKTDGTLVVKITFRDTTYAMDVRTGRHTHDMLPRVVTKTLTFHNGDTLLVTPPVPHTAGTDFAFATVTVLPTEKG